MSRLTDLIHHAKGLDPQLGMDLEAEYRALLKRRSFGLVFERHRPEAVDLPQRPVRKGDKVRILPPRGSVEKGDRRLWRVTRVERDGRSGMAHLVEIGRDTPEQRSVTPEDLVVVAAFRDPIYPGLVETGRIERGGDKPFHTVINGENYHVLEMLRYTHRHKIDAIYIDPPYNTGAKDWKYNNDYVESDDLYRHSKWLAMMERRLTLAKELLNPENSVLITTIDEKEVHRLGILLEQVFPEAETQMCSIVITPSGTSRGLFSRVDEYIFFTFIGKAKPSRVPDNLLTDAEESTNSLDWESFLRTGTAWYRQKRENMCYPVLIDPEAGTIRGVGSPFKGDDEALRPTEIDGLEAAWPVRKDGRLGIWRKNGEGLMALAEKGYAYASSRDLNRGTWSLKYLMSGAIKAIEAGEIAVERTGSRGEVVMVGERSKGVIPKTVWHRNSHNAGMHGSAMLRSLIPGRNFPFPKSLYAVEDALRTILLEKPNAVILDFFSGSGTTAHAVMRLNHQDGGRRQCISVTNNEVADDEQAALRRKGLRPGDPEWEQWGICDYITKPRIKAAITGKTPDGQSIEGDYKFTDEFPMSDGFDENAAFFTLTYEGPLSVSHHRAFERVAPLLWLRAGSRGRIITEIPERGWDVADAYGVLVALDETTAFVEAVWGSETVRITYIITDDERRFQMVCSHLPDHVTPLRLYESYLTNFEINNGRCA